MIKPTVRAYLAGVVDSDGTIGIKRSTYAMRRRGDATQPVYSERICVKQVEPHAVDLLHECFGGYRFTGNGSTPQAKRIQGWQVTDLKACACIRTILPHLRIKRGHALNCLALRKAKDESKKLRVAKGRGHVGASHRAAHISVAMENCCQEAHHLNRVGV